MDEIRVIGNVETLRSLERWVTNQILSPVQFRAMPIQTNEDGVRSDPQRTGRRIIGEPFG